MKHIEQSFLGTGWSFPPRFNKEDKEVEMSTKEEDIKESLHILLSTVPGERTMQPKYGCGLNKMVFEAMNETSKTIIKGLISDAILFFEPRITLENIELNQNDIIQGVLKINIEYTVRTTNTRSNMVYPFYINEGNNIP